MTPDSQTAGPIVLLVDDEPRIHLIVTRTLQREGWMVLNATDGEHAVEVIGPTGEPPQSVITDMRPFTPAMLLQAGRELCNGIALPQKPPQGWIGYHPGTVGDSGTGPNGPSAGDSPPACA
jgi:CheY-like chemotaxis protein